MGCEGGKKECGCVSSAVLIVISLGCWVIMMAFGWLFFAMVPQENQLVYAAAIVSSIPAYAVVLYFFYICAYGAKWFHTRSVQRCLLGVEMVAGLIDFAGGILFLAACATLDLNDPYVLAYGVCAGVFGIIAGVTNILSRSCCCAYNCCVMDDQTPTNVEEDHSMDCEGFKGLLLHLYNCFGFCQGRSDLKDQVLV